MPKSTKREDFGNIPNAALRSTQKPCSDSLGISSSGS